MTAPVRAEVLLSAGEARRLTSEIRNALGVANALLARAYAGRVWEAYGLRSWEAYCARELPELAFVKLRRDERLARVEALHDLGASTREIAAATGSSVGQAHADRKALAAPAPEVGPVCKVARVLELLAAAGDKGMTARQVEHRTGWHHGSASAALTRLHQAGRIGYRAPAKRGQTGVYVAAP